MSGCADNELHRERARQERELAASATDPGARSIHEELAAQHIAMIDPDKRPVSASAAQKPGATDPGNRDQTRDAGPENIRDIRHPESWDLVDESSDESFPASDPPPQP